MVPKTNLKITKKPNNKSASQSPSHPVKHTNQRNKTKTAKINQKQNLET